MGQQLIDPVPPPETARRATALRALFVAAASGQAGIAISTRRTQ